MAVTLCGRRAVCSLVVRLQPTLSCRRRSQHSGLIRRSFALVAYLKLQKGQTGHPF